MKTAFYRIPGTPGKGFLIDIDNLVGNEITWLKTGKHNLYCPNCGERVFFNRGTTHLLQGEKFYHEAFFSHQSSDKCSNEDCNLRVSQYLTANNRYISQKLRTPLFLRPDGNGNFTLSLGFISANKEAIRNLQDQKYKAIMIKQGQESLGEISFEDLLAEKEGGYVFLDLPAPIAKNNVISVELQNSFDDIFNDPLTPENNPDWSEHLDWFRDRNVGAIFSYSVGNAGEKIPAGGFIAAERPYLIVEKDTGGNSFINSKLSNLSKKYGFVYEHKGWLNFPKMTARYSVRKIIFPRYESIQDKREYENLVDWLQENFAVHLCDEITETRPIWPPASRKSEAYAVQPTEDMDAYLIVSNSEDNPFVQLHQSYNEKTPYWVQECNGVDVCRIPLTNRRAHVTLNEALLPTVSSYRIEENKKLPMQEFFIEQMDVLTVLARHGLHEIALKENVTSITISGPCPFALYERGNERIKRISNKNHKITVDNLYKGQRFLLLSEANQLYELAIKGNLGDAPFATMPQDEFVNDAGHNTKTSGNRYSKYNKYDCRYSR